MQQQQQLQYQITPRQDGQCILCDESDVVTLTKRGQAVQLCKRHAWDALKSNGDARPKKGDDDVVVKGKDLPGPPKNPQTPP